MDASLNIVDLIENNPIVKLSPDYNNRFIDKIKENFTETQQKLFVSSFYCYLNYNQTTEFVIDLDNVWGWVGFNQKVKAKTLLENNFILNKDYILLSRTGKQSNDTKGGHNKQTFMLNIRTFKLFCIKAGTQKANEIHEYFVKLEDIMHQVLQEECTELKETLENQKLSSQMEKELLREKTIIEQFPVNTQCVYYGIIDDKTENNECLIKYGNTNDLKLRVSQHKKTYTNFRLANAFKVENKSYIEKCIKQNNELIPHKRTLEINDVNYTELLAIDNLPFNKLDTIIKNIIKSIEYSPENYVKLLDNNIELKKEILLLNQENEKLKRDNNIETLLAENISLKQDNEKLKQHDNVAVLLSEIKQLEQIKEEYNTFKKTALKKILEENNRLKMEYETLLRKTKTHTNIETERKQLRKFQKQADGFYYINDKRYTKLTGTRQEVWDGIAYRTGGELTKDDFIMNKNGEIVSKSKSEYSTINLKPICMKRNQQ